MPFIEDNPASPDLGMRAPNLRPRPAPTPAPGVGETFGAAFRQENALVSAYSYMMERSGLAPEPNHNPLDLIKDTNYEWNYLHRFVDSVSRADTLARMSRIDREEADRRLMEAAGIGGVVANIAAGALDPTIFIPGGTVYRGYRTGAAVGRSARSVGLATAGSVAAQEAVLLGTQETRTPQEAALNVGVGAILGGAIGRALCRKLRT